MSIRLIAKELYKAQREVESLEAELAAAPNNKKEEIKERLRIKRAEWQQIRNIMDGEKTLPPSGLRLR